MRVVMHVAAGVRHGRVARAAYAVRASGRRSAVRRIDGDLVRIEVAGSGRTALATSIECRPKLVGAAVGESLRRALGLREAP